MSPKGSGMSPNGASPDFLLEIGCEELPADTLPAALNWGEQGGLAVSAAMLLLENKVSWREIRTFGTPRRLVLWVRGVGPVVEKQEEGPPVQIAFDLQGKPTRAAESFAQRHGLKVSQLKRRETPKGARLYAQYAVPVAKILAGAAPALIQKIGFPKTMRWDESGVRFARPVRWLVALYGSKPVPCLFGRIKSGGITYGTRQAGNEPVSVKSPAAYFCALRRLKVRLEEGQHLKPKGDSFEPLPLCAQKRDELLRRLRAAAQRSEGRLADQTTEEFEWLLNTVTFLAEDPVVEVGSFRKEYLDLPAEVLATSMAKHLRMFGVYSPDGKKLLPKFLAVLEGKPKNPARVTANIERILEARFSDARFFYREDTRSPLESKVEGLGKVVFHEKLGTVAERIPRLERLLKAFVEQLSLGDPTRWELERVALVCKADLVTQMVREFPSLQGVVGGHYARVSGEPIPIGVAISEQYRPRAAGDPVPVTSLGALLGLADRLDTLIGYFGVGLKPTGSADPYGLRRHALGLVRILIEPPPGIAFVGLSIDRLLDEGIQSWGSKITVDREILKKDLRGFLRERFEWLGFVVHRIHPIDRELIASVLAANEDDLAGAWQRLAILRQLWADRSKNSLIKAAKVAERTGRIVRSAQEAQLPDVVDPAVLKEPVEKELWEAWNRIAPQVREHLERRQYEEATKIYSALYPAVDTFFEKVFVMAEEADLRRNRLALMKQIHGLLAGRFADLAKLPLPGALEN